MYKSTHTHTHTQLWRRRIRKGHNLNRWNHQDKGKRPRIPLTRTQSRYILPPRQSYLAKNFRTKPLNMQKTRQIMGMKATGGGEIVQVEGGQILRSIGRKDRHSKVYTSKGPRDRRVRLAAHTAIQFYDVQDRLGYDRPSKAVDWLINKAKNAIDNLAELPPWNPNDITMAPSSDPNVGSSGMAMGPESERSSGYAFQPSIDVQPISETMKPFFPTSSGTSMMNFQNHPPDIMSRSSIQNEDLCLSLHTVQYPNSNHTLPTQQGLFSGSSPVTFEVNYPIMAGWNGGGDGESRVGYNFNTQSIPQQLMLCQSSVFSQRESLQSSFSPLPRAWEHRTTTQTVHPSSIPSSQFASEGFLEFQVPARIHGEEELGTVSHKPSSASPNIHH